MFHASPIAKVNLALALFSILAENVALMWGKGKNVWKGV